nr:MAG TPA: hypothetical protein [Caudoviricetes sp.]
MLRFCRRQNPYTIKYPHSGLKRPKSPHLPSYVTLFSQTPFKRSSNVTQM